MCWSENGDCSFHKFLLAGSVKGILYRQWNGKRGYVTKWKQ